jgi:hypothetical protein
MELLSTKFVFIKMILTVKIVNNLSIECYFYYKFVKKTILMKEKKTKVSSKAPAAGDMLTALNPTIKPVWPPKGIVLGIDYKKNVGEIVIHGEKESMTQKFKISKVGSTSGNQTKNTISKKKHSGKPENAKSSTAKAKTKNK